METKFIEATNNEQNWGKFLLLRFDQEEAKHPSVFTGRSLLVEVGWSPHNIFVIDLQTGEGARFIPGGYVKYDLDKHCIWTCPLFLYFLEWLYVQDVSDLSKLPGQVSLPEAKFSMCGQRYPGIDDEIIVK